MTTYLQEAIIGVIVFFALLSVIRRLFPAWSHKYQQLVGDWLERPECGRLLQKIGHFLQPGQGSAGCGSGCHTCSSCSTPPATPTAKKNEKTLKLHHHS